LPEQRKLYDYWCELKRDRAMPARDEISPADFPGLLPYVLLVEVRPPPELIRVRLAGTALWDIHGGEITGRTLDDSWGGNREYWRRNYELIAESRKPAAGMLRAPRVGKDHLVLFWLRLPLAGRGPDDLVLLGLDMCITASKLSGDMLGSSEPHTLAGNRG
ncbi:MAG: PAS domain-containing protein, partial [Mariprofundaceae bacterium]|nr:PAS domain-containing protein [Mariprofundaceae bacterium]